LFCALHSIAVALARVLTRPRVKSRTTNLALLLFMNSLRLAEMIVSLF